MLRVTGVTQERSKTPLANVVLAHDERHLRRKVLTLEDGTRILVDFPQPTALHNHDRLVLEDDRQVEVIAADEALMAVRPAPDQDIAVLAWHLGNRHLPAAIAKDHILIQRDHVIRDMLLKLGASVEDVTAPFEPVRGAYHSHQHGHGHAHDLVHTHDHGAHAPDAPST